MKTLALILALSIAGNAVLLAFLATKPPSASPITSPSSARAASALVSNPVAATGARDRPDVAASAARRTLSEIWENPSAEDLPELVAQLRAAGYPPEVIRSLVSGLVGRVFADRDRAIRGSAEPRPYWQGSTGPFGVTNALTPAQREALRSLGRERTQLLKELLGPDASFADAFFMETLRRRTGPFSDDKLEQLQAIRSDYADLRQAINETTAGGSVRLPEDTEKLALLAKEEEADLRAVLTADEFFEYQLRTSDTANMLRFMLAAFEPSETEFREIARLLLTQPSGIPTDAQASMNLLRTGADALAGVLPPGRIAELKIAVDPSLQPVTRVLARYNLPLQAATEVASIQNDMMQRIRQALAAAGNNPSQASAALSELNREASTRLQTVLGDRALAAYRENGGQWLQVLQNPPRTSPTPARPATP